MNVENIVATFGISVIASIISSIGVVYVVFKYTTKLNFDHYLTMLLEEIKENLQKIEELPANLEKVRGGKGAWLPTIPTNRPRPGYIKKYLSLNIYENFINQIYWMYIERGTAGKLGELYYCFGKYCDRIHDLETINRYSVPLIPTKERYSEKLFNYALSNIKDDIEKISEKFDLDDINWMKKPDWWHPEWFKDFER